VCQEPKRLFGKSWDQLQADDFACVPSVQSSVLQETGELTKAIEGENATLVCRIFGIFNSSTVRIIIYKYLC
jgi:hypothetical protein